MNDETNGYLETVNELRRKGRKIGRKQSMLPAWAAYLICISAGLGLVLLVEYGAVALLVIPVVLIVLAFHYYKIDTRPYFWPTGKGLGDTKNELIADPAYIGFLLLGLGGLIAFPFLLIKAIELKDSGYVWTSYAGGALLAIFLLTIMRLDHYFLRKKIGNE